MGSKVFHVMTVKFKTLHVVMTVKFSYDTRTAYMIAVYWSFQVMVSACLLVITFRTFLRNFAYFPNIMVANMCEHYDIVKYIFLILAHTTPC